MKLNEILAEMARLSPEDMAELPDRKGMSPYAAYLAAVKAHRTGQDSSAFEQYLAHDPEYAFYYARDVLRGRFPEGEDAINSSPEHAEHYENMLNNRFAHDDDEIQDDGSDLDQWESSYRCFEDDWISSNC